MKKIINQAPIVRYRASVSEIFFPGFWNGTFSAESQSSQSVVSFGAGLCFSTSYLERRSGRRACSADSIPAAPARAEVLATHFHVSAIPETSKRTESSRFPSIARRQQGRVAGARLDSCMPPSPSPLLDRSDLVNSLPIHEVSHDFLDNLSVGPLRKSLFDRDCSFSLRAVFVYAQKERDASASRSPASYWLNCRSGC